LKSKIKPQRKLEKKNRMTNWKNAIRMAAGCQEKFKGSQEPIGNSQFKGGQANRRAYNKQLVVVGCLLLV
jgi:hypothetical protein